MTERPRIHRPKLERSGPIRNGSTSASEEPDERAPERDEPRAFSDTIARSVDLGYRVIDEYLRQGQRAARALGDRAADPAGGFSGAIPDLYARFSRYASDFAGLWLEMLGAAGTQSPLEAYPAREPDPESPPAASELPPLGVEVRSERATSIELELRPGARFRSLAVHDLRAREVGAPRLRARCETEAGTGRVRILVEVPRDQPAGAYSGLLLDAEASVPVGTLSVRVEP